MSRLFNVHRNTISISRRHLHIKEETRKYTLPHTDNLSKYVISNTIVTSHTNPVNGRHSQSLLHEVFTNDKISSLGSPVEERTTNLEYKEINISNNRQPECLRSLPHLGVLSLLPVTGGRNRDSGLHSNKQKPVESLSIPAFKTQITLMLYFFSNFLITSGCLSNSVVLTVYQIVNHETKHLLSLTLSLDLLHFNCPHNQYTLLLF